MERAPRPPDYGREDRPLIVNALPSTVHNRDIDRRVRLDNPAERDIRGARDPKRDADGSALPRWTWISSRAGWLVHDPRRTGEITSALQWFGNVTFWLFWENGYDALAALDDDADGELAGDELRDLAIWHDRNSTGTSEPTRFVRSQPTESWRCPVGMKRATAPCLRRLRRKA